MGILRVSILKAVLYKNSEKNKVFMVNFSPKKENGTVFLERCNIEKGGAEVTFAFCGRNLGRPSSSTCISSLVVAESFVVPVAEVAAVFVIAPDKSTITCSLSSIIIDIIP